MLFTSFAFLVFLAIFLVMWPFVRGHLQARWIFLIVASFVFYGWWDWRYLFLLITTGLIDFFAALAIVRFPRWRKPWLILSLSSNLLVLGLFKYSGFLAANINHALHAVGASASLPVLQLTLPIGISFYTFQSLSYTIDVYRGEFTPTTNVFQFLAAISMFPHLVAGPIVRAADLLPQLADRERPWTEKRWSGIRLIGRGYFKKMVVADRLAPLVDAAFGAAVPAASAGYWWLIVVMFAIQIYCDFSGYTDIARGLAKWLGFEFHVNFNHPYRALSLREFWTRWHISLSTWFRDYVYIPLGGSRKGQWRSHVNMWITMILSGIWHGAAWTFVTWGALHALGLSLERIVGWPARLGRSALGRGISWLVTMIFVCIAWVFFRATSMGQALHIVSTMFAPGLWATRQPWHVSTMASALLVVLLVWEASIVLRRHRSWAAALLNIRALEPAMLACAAAACVYLRGPGHAFIYFQF